MSDGNRYSRERECAGKRPYLSKRQAKAAARHVEHAAGRMAAYRCSWCGLFHLGHKVPAEYRTRVS